jgi:hypothetical protein
MPRYGPPPDTEQQPPPPAEESTLTRWSPSRKILAVVAALGMIAAFVFNFLAPTSSGIKRPRTTTTRPAVTTTVAVPTTSGAPTTTP